MTLSDRRSSGSGSVPVLMPLVGRSWDHRPDMTRFRLDASVPRLPVDLARSGDDRVIAGVAGGLGRSLGVDPTVVRLAFVVLSFANGLGVVLYLVGWALLPDDHQPGVASPEARPPSAERAVGLGLLTVGTLLLFGRAGLVLPAEVVWAVALSAVGFGLVWARTDEEDRTRGLLVRAGIGGLALVVGLGLLFASGGVLSTIGGLGLAVLATGVGVALLLGPWILRLWRDLAVERRERIRSEERSEIAAHLHDSVLQTLALIQRADAPGRARTLARRQERELRAWLFDERPPDGDGTPATTLGAALGQVVTDVEDRHDVEVDLVVVGDCPMEPRLEALVAAVREAAHNAARHSGVADLSVYVEVEAHAVTAYVRDRGHGFDLEAVEPGRVGVRESIIGRMARHGGRADVHSAPGEGTEVVLEVGRTPAREGVS
jgi:signal transduction histidine kinase/phage shock protein PspC (stress-responsive transcriptional regulator)